MGFIWSLIIGGIIGWLAGVITGRDVPGGVIGNIIAGFIGAWLGGLILGDWGPDIGGFAIIPAIIGSIILVLIVSFILGKVRKSSSE
ncbi:GlsB/YeaQ/YmgE family stress response membrane protein [Alkalihalobacillus macyae]|uniref:GlsB/YeaQ/YmgE family stress response membrane protein n=1 Tax=Guptibacillus hwajinpoensis TaxID=208199 RepID=UPI00273CD7B4|nr:GlsB/YeaQ/YmgE family stress response membrane protein [Alkalihalobacillus macyae]MDP4552934.1 GlsB/YeaQ/YmgE family stress response membrane protein [Alkalihalobacillus macyae]